MIIHRSNRTEVLIKDLGALVGGPGLDPFTKETLVVQGRGMERWLSMQLADQLGIWANPKILSLRGLVDMIFKRVLDREIDPVFDPDSLLWSIADLLPGLAKQQGFETIGRYLEGDEDGRKRFQLSRQLANTFYQYMTYRPEMIAAWQSPTPGAAETPDERWQGLLWRALIERLGEHHLVGRADELMRHLEAGMPPAAPLPERVSIFGISSLPPLYLSLFSALADEFELHLFMLSPTREYWADLASPRETRRALRQAETQDEESLHLAESHSLLASLGRLGRDFQQMLEDDGSYREGAEDLYRDPEHEGRSMLRVLQSDMLNLRVGGEGVGGGDVTGDEVEGEDTLRAMIEADRSIRVHACHSPMREVEVLREELLACFEALPTLEPQDVVVMTPDIETYAPYIEAVFGVRSRGSDAVAAGDGEIPFRIADRGPFTGDQVVAAFRRGLDCVGGRFSATSALDLLGLVCVREQFGFETRELETVKTWVVESGIRWGVDGAHRATYGQPGDDANTWRFGLDRLLLGYGAPDDRRTLFRGTRPLDAVEGQAADRLGRTLDYCEFLFEERETLSAPRPPEQWRDALLAFLAKLAKRNDENEEQHLLLRKVLDAIARQAASASFAGEVSLASMREQIDRGLEHSRTPHGFLAGGVTFCELVPMRSIPFQVVCLLGLNDDAFPRIRHAHGFDLVAKNPRVGDRTTREDDRYLFLEALLAARERLVITFVGQSIKDGSALPPSVVVDELLDSLAESFASRGMERGPVQAERRSAFRKTVLIQHPLQPFSPRYFEPDRDAGFEAHSALYCEAALQLVKSQRLDPPFIERVSPATRQRELNNAGAGGDIEEIDLDELIAFFRHPVRHFIRNQLQISLREDGDDLALREPFALDALEQFKLGSELFEWVNGGVSHEQAYALVRGSGQLPHGLAGRIVFDDLMRSVVALSERVGELRGAQTTEHAPFDIDVAGVRLRGELTDLAPKGQVLARFAKLGGATELGAWIRHLVLQWVPPDLAATGRDTYLVGRPSRTEATIARFGEVESPEQKLAELVELFREGTKAPLPLFPKTSRAYAEATREDKEPDEALIKASTRFNEDHVIRGEGLDPYNVLAFKGVDPLDPGAELVGDRRFGELANLVFAPMLEARKVVQ